MSAIGRKCQVVNLDPANDRTAYPCALDVRDLVTLDEIMDENGLGPNGGVVYALEELEENIDWLQGELLKFDRKLLDLALDSNEEIFIILLTIEEDYVIFDCPGQVELFTHHSSLRNIFLKLQKFGYRVC